MACQVMSKPVIDYYFTIQSPWSFFGLSRLRAAAEKSGATVNYKACNLGAVFSVTGGLPVKKRSPQRLAYRMMELKRWKVKLNLDFNFEPAFFPFDDNPANKMIMAATDAGLDVGDLANALHRGVWCDDLNMAEDDNLISVATAAGYDGQALLQTVQSGSLDARYEALTQEAIDANVFGAPTYVVDGENFWGQDRLDFLKERLLG